MSLCHTVTGIFLDKDCSKKFEAIAGFPLPKSATYELDSILTDCIPVYPLFEQTFDTFYFA